MFVLKLILFTFYICKPWSKFLYDQIFKPLSRMLSKNVFASFWLKANVLAV